MSNLDFDINEVDNFGLHCLHYPVFLVSVLAIYFSFEKQLM